MTLLRLLRYDLRRAGGPALAAPAAVLAVGLLLVLAIRGRGGETVGVAVFVVQQLAPLGCGIGIASILGSECGRELQMSLPTAFSSTLVRRWMLVLGWAIGLTLLTSAALEAARMWPQQPAALRSQLVWLAPTVALAGLGALASAASRSTTTSTAVLAAVWLVQDLDSRVLASQPLTRLLFLFPDPEIASPDWLLNRMVLILAGSLALVLAWALVAVDEVPRLRRLRIWSALS